MASSSTQTMKVFQEESIQKMTCSPSLTSCPCSESVCIWSQSLLHTILQVLFGNDMLPDLQHAPTPVSSSTSFLHTCLSIWPCFPPFHHTFVHGRDIAQTALHANAYCNKSLVWFKVSSFIINTENHLRSPVVTQSQGDLGG